MINRIVRLSFHEHKVSDFMEVFETSKNQIANFPGCKALSLFRDSKLENVFYTQSWWESEADLENYRNSILFQDTWAQTKVLFNDKPMAWSLQLVDKVL